MSDVTATCWALAAIFAALRSRRQATWALAAGAAFGIAFLVRPTDIFLAIPILCCLRLKPQTLWFFFLGGLPFAGIFFAHNTLAYGHPLRTGYAAIQLQGSIMAKDFTVRFGNYTHWLSVTLSPCFCRLAGRSGESSVGLENAPAHYLLVRNFSPVLFLL